MLSKVPVSVSAASAVAEKQSGLRLRPDSAPRRAAPVADRDAAVLDDGQQPGRVLRAADALELPLRLERGRGQRGAVQRGAVLRVGQRQRHRRLLRRRRQQGLERVRRELVVGPDLDLVERDPLGHRRDGQLLLRYLVPEAPHLAYHAFPSL